MGSAQSANWAISSWSWQVWGSRLSTFTQIPGLLDTESMKNRMKESHTSSSSSSFITHTLVKTIPMCLGILRLCEKSLCITKTTHMQYYQCWNHEYWLTKFIKLFAFILQLLHELWHLALFSESSAILHKAYINVHSSCNIKENSEEDKASTCLHLFFFHYYLFSKSVSPYLYCQRQFLVFRHKRHKPV